MRRMALVGTACLLLVMTGCIEIEEVVTLEKDFSGTASLDFAMDMEPFAAFTAQFKREMEGKEGKPTQEEIDLVRQELLASQKGSMNMPTKEEIAKDLPPGVKLLESKAIDEGLKFGGNLKVAFDHFDKLQQLEVKQKTAGEAGEAESASAKMGFPEKPFGGLHFKDEGATLVMSGMGFAPPAEMSSAPSLDDLPPEVAATLKKIKLVIKVTAPFEVVEHNATRKEDKTLIWEYDYDTLMSRTPEQMQEGLRARFKK
ncbi:MAG TPA: hypothetical protein VF789_02605 [Thermoanaerobaculia bacterium]